MKRNSRLVQLLILTAIGTTVFAGCGSKDNKTSTTEAVTDITATEGKTTESKATAIDAMESNQQISTKTDSDKVASADEMVEPEDIVDPNMVPVFGNQIKDGEYDIKVDSSSSMFKITECKLEVKDGKMTAVLTMGGKGYKYLYMGKGEDAINAKESDYIEYKENEKGENTFTVPVEALDKGIDCTAFSKKKEKWYDRVLLFRADSLPQDALSEDTLIKADSLGLADGEYSVNVTLAGGSGKVALEPTAKLIVQGDTVKSVIVFCSKNYDYVIVDGTKYMNENEGGNSTFTIPVLGFNYKMPIIGDTVAMSQPHEIEYTVYFDKDTIK